MPNEILTLLGQIFEVCIIPLLGVLVPFVIKWIRTKTATLAENANNETAKKYIGMLSDTVTNAVIAVNQTYVDALKGLPSGKGLAFTLSGSISGVPHCET